MNIDTIPFQTVLELMSDEIWRKQIPKQISETGADIPSLRERQQIVNTMLPKASFDGTTIRFDAEHSALTAIPFFNYLLLNDNPAFTDFPDGSGRMTGKSWSIVGFSSFDEISEYIQQEKSVCFSVFVRHQDYYEKVQHRFAIQRPGCEKTYVSEWGFYYPDEDFTDTYDRNPTYQYFFEIIGLCEIHCEDEISTCLVHSLDDLGDELGAKATSKETQWIRDLIRFTGYHYQETGTVYYNGAIYTYCIEIDKDSIMWNFFNELKEPYCPSLRSFCTPAVNCCHKKGKMLYGW